MTNNGGAYDPNESVFTCPLDGMYYFTFSIYSGHLSVEERTSAMIQMDEQNYSEAVCQNHGPDDLRTQCATSLVIHCNQGQRVFVAAAETEVQLYGYSRRSTFSGFLIHEDIYHHITNKITNL